jgi:glycosyltransferase involved in cell wall biosynthesis
VPQKSIDEVRAAYTQKRCEYIWQISGNPDPIMRLNTALLDNDTQEIESMKQLLSMQQVKYNLQNTADGIFNKSRLRVAYLLPFTGMTGGTQIQIEQSNHLAAKGHDVLVYSHAQKPTWIECKTRYFQIPAECNIYEIVPKVDVVIAGYWDLVVDALKIDAPVKYHFAQGDFDIFEFDKMEPSQKHIITSAYQLPVRILTVSGIMNQKINELFGRASTIIPNAIDKTIFYPSGKSGMENSPLEILLVGSDTIRFKGHDTILGALFGLKALGYSFKINWLTQLPLKNSYKSLGMDIKQYIAPSREQIGNIYRKCDIYICGSKYESFGLPPLEAMSCGVTVVTSDNGGIRDYAVDEYNSLIYEPGNVRMLVNKLQKLFDCPELRKTLKINGLLTSKKYSWNKSVAILGKELQKSATTTIQAVKTF